MIVALSGVSGRAAPPRKDQSPFKVGDKVEFKFGAEVIQGEVIGFSAGGWVKVRCVLHGIETTLTRPPDTLRLISRKGPSTPKDKEPDEKKKSAQTDSEYPLRTWTDSTRKYKTEARFVALDGGKVRLRKADGSTISLPLERLSEADRKYVEQLTQESSGDPFVGDRPDEDAGGDQAGEATGGEKEPPQGNWFRARHIKVDPDAGGVIAPDIAPQWRPGALRPILLETPKESTGRNLFREKIEKVFVDRSGQRLLVAHVYDAPRDKGASRLRVEFCSLKTGMTTESVLLDTSYIPADLSPDGNALVCIPPQKKRVMEKHSGVEVWQLGKAGKLINRWNARDQISTALRLWSVDGALFVSDKQLLTVGGTAGRVVLWNINGAEAVYSLDIKRGTLPALSPNRKQLAVARPSRV